MVSAAPGVSSCGASTDGRREGCWGRGCLEWVVFSCGMEQCERVGLITELRPCGLRGPNLALGGPRCVRMAGLQLEALGSCAFPTVPHGTVSWPVREAVLWSRPWAVTGWGRQAFQWPRSLAPVLCLGLCWCLRETATGSAGSFRLAPERHSRQEAAGKGALAAALGGCWLYGGQASVLPTPCIA